MEGDYQICFDNSFSRFSEKMVFFEIIVEGPGGDVDADDEWTGALEDADGSLLEYKLEDIMVRHSRVFVCVCVSTRILRSSGSHLLKSQSETFSFVSLFSFRRTRRPSCSFENRQFKQLT